MTDIDWDERYGSTERLWSGNPNEALTAEASTLTPGTVLDVGCGEGADVVWLAQHGWVATGLEISEVAVNRAADAALNAGVVASFIHAPVTEADLATYDLVTTMYPAIPHEEGSTAEHVMLDAVVPGGHLLFVHHAPDVHADDHGEHSWDSAAYVSAESLLTAAPGWTVVTDEVRDRHVTEGAGAHSHADRVLLLQRP